MYFGSAPADRIDDDAMHDPRSIAKKFGPWSAAPAARFGESNIALVNESSRIEYNVASQPQA
jgi:hypothetical protein